MKRYQIYSPIKRPVLQRMPWWQVDLQALPPYSWCDLCGAEVYAADACLCQRCQEKYPI